MRQHTPGPWSYASTRDESTYALFDSNDNCRLMFLVGGIKSTHDQIMEQHRQNETDARRIVKCVNAMDGIGDDNALFFPGNTVRSVISSMKLKQLELEQQRDALLAAIDTMLNGASLVDIGNDCGIGIEDSDLESFNAVVNRIKAGAK